MEDIVSAAAQLAAEQLKQRQLLTAAQNRTDALVVSRDPCNNHVESSTNAKVATRHRCIASAECPG
jgi:hypothetical protein